MTAPTPSEPALIAESVAVQQVVAGWIAVAFHHALASTDPIVYGPNTLALADSLVLYLLSLGYEIKPMDPQVKSLTEPFRKRLIDGADDAR